MKSFNILHINQMAKSHTQTDAPHLSRGGRALFVYVLTLLLSTYPFVFNLILPIPSITILMAVNFFVFFILTSKNVVSSTKEVFIVCAIQIIGTVLSMAITMDFEYYKQVLYILSGLIVISYIRAVGVKQFLFYYNRFILIIAILGAISSILTIILGDRVLLEYTNMDGRPGWLVYFTFTNSNTGSFIRYSGIFDEPGAMAFWGMFSLLFNKLFVHDKKIEIPLIICLLLTLSLSFIIQIFFYLFFFYFLESKISTKITVFFLTILVFLLSYFILDEDSPIYMLTFGRLGIGTSYNLFEDSSRAVLMDMAKKAWESSPWFGIGTTQFYGGEYMADNPYETLAKDGIIGTAFLYLPLIISFFKGAKNKDILFATIILGLGYLQRPFHINFLHYTIMYLFFYITMLINKKYIKERMIYAQV